jgi:hypothetical protein
MNTLPNPTLWRRPGTRLGWWAVGLGTAFVVLFVIHSLLVMPLKPYSVGDARYWFLLPYYNIVMLLCGLLSGIFGLIALLRQHERSWLVWLTLLPGALVLSFVLGEFTNPH